MPPRVFTEEDFLSPEETPRIFSEEDFASDDSTPTEAVISATSPSTNFLDDWSRGTRDFLVNKAPSAIGGAVRDYAIAGPASFISGNTLPEEQEEWRRTFDTADQLLNGTSVGRSLKVAGKTAMGIPADILHGAGTLVETAKNLPEAFNRASEDAFFDEEGNRRGYFESLIPGSVAPLTGITSAFLDASTRDEPLPSGKQAASKELLAALPGIAKAFASKTPAGRVAGVAGAIGGPFLMNQVLQLEGERPDTPLKTDLENTIGAGFGAIGGAHVYNRGIFPTTKAALEVPGKVFSALGEKGKQLSGVPENIVRALGINEGEIVSDLRKDPGSFAEIGIGEFVDPEILPASSSGKPLPSRLIGDSPAMIGDSNLPVVSIGNDISSRRRPLSGESQKILNASGESGIATIPGKKGAATIPDLVKEAQDVFQVDSPPQSSWKVGENDTFTLIQKNLINEKGVAGEKRASVISQMPEGSSVKVGETGIGKLLEKATQSLEASERDSATTFAIKQLKAFSEKIWGTNSPAATKFSNLIYKYFDRQGLKSATQLSGEERAEFQSLIRGLMEEEIPLQEALELKTKLGARSNWQANLSGTISAEDAKGVANLYKQLSNSLSKAIEGKINEHASATNNPLLLKDYKDANRRYAVLSTLQPFVERMVSRTRAANSYIGDRPQRTWGQSIAGAVYPQMKNPLAAIETAQDPLAYGSRAAQTRNLLAKRTGQLAPMAGKVADMAGAVPLTQGLRAYDKAPAGFNAIFGAAAVNELLPRNPEGWDARKVALFLDKVDGLPEEPIAHEMAKILTQSLQAGNRFKIEAVLEGMTKLVPAAFEDGWGVGGRIRNPDLQQEYLQHLQRLKEQGKVPAAFVRKQEVAFRKPDDLRILPQTNKVEIKPEIDQTRVDLGSGSSYVY